MERYKTFSFNFKGLIFMALTAYFISLFSAQAKTTVEDIDYLYMHIGLQIAHPLPEEFKKERLKFEGNYKKYTSAVYKRATNEIHFTPTRKGSAVMIIKNRKNKIIGRLHIDIQKDNLHKIAAELKDLLISVDGIEIKIYNKRVIIDGQVLLPREMTRIKSVIAQYNPQLVQSLVTYSPEAQKKIAEIIETEIGYPEVKVRYAYNRFLLEGCVSNGKEKQKAFSIAKLYTQFEVSPVGKGAKRRGVSILEDDLSFPCESEKRADEEKANKPKEIEKLIQIVVHFVEMNKSFDKGFFFQWTPAIQDNQSQISSSLGNAPAAPSGITAVLTATVSNFFPKLNWAKSFGFARVLHNSSILVKNGTEGTIYQETQIPTQQVTGDASSGSRTVAKVNTTVTPKIIGDRDHIVQMKVQITVASTETAVGTTSRQIRTDIHVNNGSSAVIGGMISSSLSRDYNKNPVSLDGGQPLLNLYSGKNYKTQKQQFVVFITPLIKSSASLGVERMKRKFKLDE